MINWAEWMVSRLVRERDWKWSFSERIKTMIK
jgi:hypothetical protein